MNGDLDVSLETDRLEQLLDTPVPAAPPVVLLRERRRGLSPWFLIPLCFVVPLCAILVYHRLFVQPAQQEALEARDASEKAREAFEKLQAGLASVPATPPAGAPAPATPGNPPAPTSVDSPASVSLPPAFAGAEAAQPADPKVATAAGAGSTPAAAAGNAVGPAQPAAPTGPVAGPPPAATPANPPVDTAANAAKTAARPTLATGFDDDRVFRPDAEPASGFKEAGAADNAQAPPKGSDPAAPALAPLPTKEETERQIAEEAKKKQEELNGAIENRVDGLRAKVAEDRARFREELRDALARDGKAAGPEIDKISRRYSAECDREIVSKAREFWSHRTQKNKSGGSKVAQLRTAGVPESVILDFMSADMHKMIGTRYGPKDASDVRVKAAQKLLNYKLPDEAPEAAASNGKLAGGRPE